MYTSKRANAFGVARRLAAFALAFLLCAQAPAQVYAADGSAASEQGSLAVRGIDTFQIGGDAFECATVSGLGGNTLYADVTVNDSAAHDLEYKYDNATDTFGVVQLNKKASYVAACSGSLTLSFYSEKSTERQGASALLSANVYAVCMQVDGETMSVEDSMIGIRTAQASEATLAIQAPTQIVRGDSTYVLKNQVVGNKVTPTLKDGVLYVSYQKVDSSEAVSGSVVYVDEQGNELKSESIVLNKYAQQDVALPENFTVNGKVYTPKAATSTITLTAENPVQRVYCIAQAEADKTTLDVTINYVSENGTALMTDKVNVAAGGYKYAPATAFSQANDGSVMRYTLVGAEDSLGNKYTAEQAKTLSLSNRGAQAYTLEYQPEINELTYTVNFALVSAGNGGNTNVSVATQQTAKVSSTQDAAIALPETIEQDGVTYTRFGSDSSLTYTWADLQAGRMLSDTVYYVASDVVTPQAYNVNVRYVDAVSGNQIGGETLTCQPNGEALSITSPASVTYEGAEYQRLNGQDAAITHRFYAPYRTYTVYYAQPGAMAQGDTTVVRTEVVDGGVRYYTIASDGTVSASGTGAASTTTGGLVAATPYTSVATTTQGADGTSANTQTDVTAPSGDTAYSERLSEDETPLSASAEGESGQPNFGLIAAGVAALFAIAAGIAVVFARRKANGSNDVKGA